MASCRVWGPGEGTEVPRDLGKAAVCLVAAGPQRRRRLPQLCSRTLVPGFCPPAGDCGCLSLPAPLYLCLVPPVSLVHKLFGAWFLYLNT